MDEASFISAAKTADAIYASAFGCRNRSSTVWKTVKSLLSAAWVLIVLTSKPRLRAAFRSPIFPTPLSRKSRTMRWPCCSQGFRRVVVQDKMARDGRWAEGRPALLKIPRLAGQTLGFISFGRVARAVARRAAPFGLRMAAYDPFIEETLMSEYGVLPATLSEVLSQSDFVSMHAPARPEVHQMLGEQHFRQMKPTRHVHQHRPWHDCGRRSHDQSVAGGLDTCARSLGRPL